MYGTTGMTWNQVWEECLAMWDWISDVWGPGEDVRQLKREYLVDHKKLALVCDCFFCDWATIQFDSKQSQPIYFSGDHVISSWSRCSYCPGFMVDPNFCCNNPAYSHEEKPLEFFEELKRLNMIRLLDEITEPPQV